MVTGHQQSLVQAKPQADDVYLIKVGQLRMLCYVLSLDLISKRVLGAVA